ncbi:hypothetical protein [Microbulbifer sp. SSSA005]|uniref:hypothetical protein n=1 Tax=Microbulbifer sp. SSSA005 TaxID=3243378 RepID=UPI00403A53FB
MKKNIKLTTLSLLLFGCTENPENREIILGNEEVNCLQINYGMSDQELIKRISAKDRKPDFTLLKKVHLPANASLCQKQDFIETILYLSSNQRSYTETDPQVSMISRALKGNEEDFLPMAKSNWHSPNSYISDAYISMISDRGMKDFVKKHFSKYPWLIEAITRNGWSKDFKEEIIQFVENKNGHVNYHFATAFSQINDPATEDLILKSFFNSGANRHIFYSRIEKLEWLTLTPSLEKLWQSPDVNKLELAYLAYPLGITGFIPVLDYLANNENGSTYDNPYRSNIDFFNYLTDQNLQPGELKEWLKLNRSSLVFDNESRKFNLN